MLRTLAIAVLVTSPTWTFAEAVTGKASILDGDTIEIHGQRIRLEGIDAPESRQTCGGGWRCGKDAAFALADRIGTATVGCEVHGKDRYKRLLAVCYSGGEDLNRWMVRNGWAVAYRKYSAAYVQDETRARAAGLNIWSTNFQMPWDWRREH